MSALIVHPPISPTSVCFASHAASLAMSVSVFTMTHCTIRPQSGLFCGMHGIGLTHAGCLSGVVAAAGVVWPGFVSYDNRDSAEKAISQMNGYQVRYSVVVSLFLLKCFDNAVAQECVRAALCSPSVARAHSCTSWCVCGVFGPLKPCT